MEPDVGDTRVRIAERRSRPADVQRGHRPGARIHGRAIVILAGGEALEPEVVVRPTGPAENAIRAARAHVEARGARGPRGEGGQGEGEGQQGVTHGHETSLRKRGAMIAPRSGAGLVRRDTPARALG